MRAQMMNFKRSDEVESRGMNEGYKSSSGFEAANYGPGGLGVKFAPEAESGGMFGTVCFLLISWETYVLTRRCGDLER